MVTQPISTSSVCLKSRRFAWNRQRVEHFLFLSQKYLTWARLFPIIGLVQIYSCVGVQVS